MNLSVVLNISSILLGIIGLSLYFIGKFEQNQRYNKTMRLLLDISTEVDRNEEKPGINMKNEKNSYSILKSRIMPLSDPLRKSLLLIAKSTKPIKQSEIHRLLNLKKSKIIMHLQILLMGDFIELKEKDNEIYIDINPNYNRDEIIEYISYK